MTLPRYTIRRSARARHVSLKVTPARGVEVIVPRRFDVAGIPQLVMERRGWIEKQLDRQRVHASRWRQAAAIRPDEILLPATGEAWQIEYRQSDAPSVRVTSRSDFRLMVRGNVSDLDRVRAALRRWLARHARKHLVARLQHLSDLHGLPFVKATVRGQKTRWGSCSSRRTISINYQLLFLEKKLVDCVLLHELCHTRFLNHGPGFWALLGSLEPDCRALHRELRDGWQKLPAWPSC